MSTITALPTPPTREDAANFSARADAFLLALVAFVTQTNTVVGEVLANANAAAASVVSAVNAPGTSGTSASSVAISLGNQTFVTQTGKNFTPGQWVAPFRTSDPTKWMVGTIGTYNSGTGAMTVNVLATNGAGTFTDWTIPLSAPSLLTAASVAQIWAGTSNVTAMTPAALIGASAPIVIPDTSIITPDLSAGFNFALTALAGNRTLANPTNMLPGKSGIFVVPQDTTGGRALAVGSFYKFANGVPSFSTGANALDVISYFVFSSSVILCTLIKGFA